MKKVKAIAFIILTLMFLLMAVNKLVMPLPDWTIRMVGVIMMLALPVMAYCIVKGSMDE